MKTYILIGPDGKRYESRVPGTLGGHKRNKGYGRLDCPSALHWIAKGYYVKHRVFFADEPTAIAAGYRPCAALYERALCRVEAGTGKRTKQGRRACALSNVVRVLIYCTEGEKT